MFRDRGDGLYNTGGPDASSVYDLTSKHGTAESSEQPVVILNSDSDDDACETGQQLGRGKRAQTSNKSGFANKLGQLRQKLKTRQLSTTEVEQPVYDLASPCKEAAEEKAKGKASSKASSSLSQTRITKQFGLSRDMNKYLDDVTLIQTVTSIT